MIAELVPILRLPGTAPHVFDYRIPSGMNIVPGMIVSAPFRNKTIRALVRSCGTKSRYTNLKEIQSIVTSNPVIDKTGWSFFDWLVTDLCVHPSMVASHIFARLPENKRQLAFSGLCGTTQNTKRGTLLWYTSNHELTAALKNRPNTLLLCPSIARAKEMISMLKGESLLITHLSGKRAWFSAVTGNSKTRVVSTRLGVFLPRRFDHIVVIDEEDPDHKQSDMNPRYDARRIAYTRHALEGSTLTLTSVCPRVITYAASERGLLKVQKPSDDPINVPRRIILPPQASSMSHQLIDAITEALDRQRSVLLYHGTRGYARMLRCNDCGRSADCDVCGTTMRLTTETTLACMRCKTVKGAPLQCPHCRSTKIRPVGFGIERLTSIVRKEFTRTPVRSFELLDGAEKEPSILMATQDLFRPSSRTYSLGLVALPSVESIFSHHSYLGTEQAVTTLRKLAIFAHQHNVPFIIQSFSEIATPVNFTELQTFYHEELGLRRTLQLPPYAQLFRVILTGSSQSIAASIRLLREKCGDRLEFLDPDTVEPRARKRIAKTLYLKLPSTSVSSELCQAVASLSGAHLDRDPQVL